MAAPEPNAGVMVPPPRVRDSARNTRYAYLVGRLNNRQITMEEATELFAVMQEMLQMSEAARLALARVPPPPRPPTPSGAPAPSAAPAPAPSGMTGDDLLMAGLLAIGAGAALIAAMAQKAQGAPPGGGPTPASRPKPESTSPPG